MEIKLRSKLLHSATYDPTSQLLILVMANGHRREFVEVPEQVFDDLQATKSPGSYYTKHIKNTYSPSPM